MRLKILYEYYQATKFRGVWMCVFKVILIVATSGLYRFVTLELMLVIMKLVLIGYTKITYIQLIYDYIYYLLKQYLWHHILLKLIIQYITYIKNVKMHIQIPLKNNNLKR